MSLRLEQHVTHCLGSARLAETRHRGSRSLPPTIRLPPPRCALRWARKANTTNDRPPEGGLYVQTRSDRERRCFAQPANVEPSECRFVWGNVITYSPGSARLAEMDTEDRSRCHRPSASSRTLRASYRRRATSLLRALRYGGQERWPLRTTNSCRCRRLPRSPSRSAAARTCVR
jgi:hypothetical protein